MSVLELNAENFEDEVIHTEKPVLIDFWASWCGPCRMLSPIVDELAEEHPEMKVCKVNVDEQEELAARFDIMSIPTLLVFRNGEQVAQSVGVQSKQAILDMVNNSIQ